MDKSQMKAMYEEGSELLETKGGQSPQPSPGTEAKMVVVDSGSGTMGNILVVGSVFYGYWIIESIPLVLVMLCVWGKPQVLV